VCLNRAFDCASLTLGSGLWRAVNRAGFAGGLCTAVHVNQIVLINYKSKQLNSDPVLMLLGPPPAIL
jgi:hypothetical protein